MFSPDLSQHWLSEQDDAATAAPASKRDDEPLSPSQEEALEALVGRVNAARTVF